MIWKNKTDVSSANKMCKNTLMEHLDIVIEEIGNDYIIASMPVDHRTVQPDGILHGGATASLAETLGSIASYMMLEDTKVYRVAGVDLQVSHLSSAVSGRVTAKVKPIKTGKNIHFWQIEIRDKGQKIITHAKLTVMVIKRN